MSNLMTALMDRLFGKYDRMAELAKLVKDNIADTVTTGRSVWRESYAFNDIGEMRGFRVLGNGHFSLAVQYDDEPGIVYKIGLKKEDSGAAYAAWCRANPGDHVPVIYEMRRYSSCYIVKMPRYYEVWDRRVVCLSNMVLMEECSGIYFDDEDVQHHITDEDAEAELPVNLIETLNAITKFFAGVATFDLHRENLMWSSEDEETRRIIITDPVSFRAGYD